MGCDPSSLFLPENGKAWNSTNGKKWELECELNYEIEKGLFFRPSVVMIFNFNIYQLFKFQIVIFISAKTEHGFRRIKLLSNADFLLKVNIKQCIFMIN